MNIHYIGIRKSLKNVLTNIEQRTEDFPLQIIDLGGEIEYDAELISSYTDSKIETIILSNRRYYLDDPLGHLESDLLNRYQYSILYRTSPLDITIDIYREWADATGALITAFSPNGVSWINTEDVAEACLIDRNDIRERSGKAFELTGPKRISMETLKSSFEKQLKKKIELHCLDRDNVINIMTQNKVPLEIAEWLVEFQEQSSDNRMQDTTQIIEQIIGHPPKEPRLFKGKS